MVVRRVNKEVGQHSVRRAQSEDIQRPDARKREIGIKPPRHFLLLPSIWQRSRLKIKHGARLPCSFFSLSKTIPTCLPRQECYFILVSSVQQQDFPWQDVNI